MSAKLIIGSDFDFSSTKQSRNQRRADHGLTVKCCQGERPVVSKQDRGQKNGVRKIAGSYLSDPIFLTFLFKKARFQELV
jgi:hypothetical protein